MVGLLIGALAIVGMLQTYAISEGQKRTVTGGSDAQTNGAVALYGLEQDISQGGYGVSTMNLLSCSISGSPLPAGASLTIAPVAINSPTIPAGDPNTDTLLVVYGNSGNAPEGDGITAQPGTNVYTIQTPTSFVVNEYVVAVPQSPPTPCSLIVDNINTIVAQNVTVAVGTAGTVNGKLYDLGPAPTIVGYAVRGGNLTVCNYMANDCSITANWAPFVSNIVSLRAEYGKDTSNPMDAIVDSYNQAAPASACDYARISAVRFVIVARNSKYDKTAVTSASPAWLGSAVNATTNPTAYPIDLTKNPDGSANANWQNYRYEVFQTVAPIRNISWLGAQSGC
jgi:type IV pilus assembly protein PilW